MTTLAELIDAHCGDLVLVQDYPAIAERLNAPTTKDNPAKEPAQVAAPVTLKSVMELVPPAEMVVVYKTMPQLIPDLKAAIDQSDREYMLALLTIAATAQVISAETIGKLQELLVATVDDPSWSATVAGPSLATAAGLPRVTSVMVQAVLA